ncbi:MAG: type IV pilin protein [Gammaproteobacteria bacterium]|nr:type IV pilin protein [Gammaproteobacteria bacterium]
MKRYLSGFTLVELLIIVAIVAILASLAYPSYQNHVTRTRYADAKVKLLEIMQQQRKFFTSNNTYTTNLIADLSYADAGGGSVSTEGAFYLISAGTCGTPAEPITQCIQLTATATFSGGLGDLTYNSRNEKGGPANAW